MSSKTDTEVMIDGKGYTLSGYESEEYLQKVASYVNSKIAEFQKVDSFTRLPVDMRNILLQLNMADDYFKARRQAELLEEDLKAKETELYELKHELISTQIKLENLEKHSGGTGSGSQRTGGQSAGGLSSQQTTGQASNGQSAGGRSSSGRGRNDRHGGKNS